MTPPSPIDETQKQSPARVSSLAFVLAAVLAFLAVPACSGQLDESLPTDQQQTSEQPKSGGEQTPASAQETDPGEPSPLEELVEAHARPAAEQSFLATDPEQAFPRLSGEVMQVNLGGKNVVVEEFGGELVFEGDILVPPSMVILEGAEAIYEPGGQVAFESTDDDGESTVHALTARTRAHWENGVVPYVIDPLLPNPERVTDAIAHWEASTNLVFQERAHEADYLYFTPSNGCSSYIGKIGGQQPVYLASGCSTGNTIHEIGHAIGLWHEHSRVDRDDSIVINWNNIRTGHDHNFKTYVQQGFDGDEHTAALDFDSVMMYGSYSFSNNGRPTITKLDGSTFTIQRNGLSDGDISGIDQLYPEGGGEPQYVNGRFYTIAGLTVLRYNDLWYFYTKYGYKRVELVNDRWYWV